jgi:hypothetical protein
MIRVVLLVLVGAVLLAGCVAADEPVTGDAVIRGRAGASEIVITTTSRVAGAIHSLTWNGREFIDSFDHGRQLQSASNFDAGSAYSDETFNPTEAGSRRDGRGPTSTSRLLNGTVTASELKTTTRMAFWLAPGETSSGHPAKNSTLLSDHLLTKRVRIGYKRWPHAIHYDVTFRVPMGERHTFAQFESLTGYMPESFSRFRKFNPRSGELEPLSDGPGEQAFPVVAATESGRHAMGIFSPDQPSRGFENAGYGRWRFAAERVVKWNCVFRVRDRSGVAPGDYSYRHFVIVGDLETVRDTLRGLHEEFRPK